MALGVLALDPKGHFWGEGRKITWAVKGGRDPEAQPLPETWPGLAWRERWARMGPATVECARPGGRTFTGGARVPLLPEGKSRTEGKGDAPSNGC